MVLVPLERTATTWVRGIHEKELPTKFQYADFAPVFQAEFFDAEFWAELLSKSEAR